MFGKLHIRISCAFWLCVFSKCKTMIFVYLYTLFSHQLILWRLPKLGILRWWYHSTDVWLFRISGSRHGWSQWCESLHPFWYCQGEDVGIWENTDRLVDLWICFCLQTSAKLQVLCEVDIFSHMPNQLATLYRLLFELAVAGAGIALLGATACIVWTPGDGFSLCCCQSVNGETSWWENERDSMYLRKGGLIKFERCISYVFRLEQVVGFAPFHQTYFSAAVEWFWLTIFSMHHILCSIDHCLYVADFLELPSPKRT